MHASKRLLLAVVLVFAPAARGTRRADTAPSRMCPLDGGGLTIAFAPELLA